MTTTTQVETLQINVDQITADLAEAKKLTDETLKKTKAEAALLKAETAKTSIEKAKEEANKKLEALKNKTDATSKAEARELEAEIKEYEDMLVTLDSTKTELMTLKTGVTTPVETPSTNNETVDNTSDLDKITAGIAELKTMATALQTLVDDFKKNKETLTETEKTAKQKEIDDKKAAMEVKRKEIQDLIDKIRKWRSDVKFDDIEDQTIRETLKDQKLKEEATLKENEKELKEIITPSTTFREKVKERANKTRWWVKEHPRQTAGIATGVGLVIRGISRLFRRKKKKSEEGEEESKEKKWFWDRRYGKALKRWLIGTGIRFIGKGLITGKRPRSKEEGTGADAGDVMKSTENGAKSFEKLQKEDKETAESLNTVGDKVNALYDDVYKFNDGTIPESMEKTKLGAGKDKYAWAIPLALQNTFGDINDMEGQKWFFTICSYSTLTEIKKEFASMIANGLATVASNTLSIFGFSWLLDKDNVEAKVEEFLWGTNKIDEVHLVFRNILKVMSYTNYLETAYLAKEIDTQVKVWKTLYKKKDDGTYETITFPTDEKEIKELITNMQYHPSDYKIGTTDVDDLRDEFRSKKLSEIFTTYSMTTADILKYNYDITDDLKSINDKRDETVDNLTADNKEKTLETLKSGVEDEIADGMRESTKRLFPFLHITEIRRDETATKKKIKEDAWFKKILADFYTKFDELKKETDMTKVKASIDEYYATLKELRTTQNSIVDMTDKNGNILVGAVTTFTSTFTWIGYCFTHGAQLIYEWEYLKWAAYLYGGVSSVAVIGNLVWLSKSNSVLGTATRRSTNIAKAPFKVIDAMLPKSLMLAKVTDYIPTCLAKTWYNTPKAITGWLSRGMSFQKAYSLYKAVGPCGETAKWFFTDVLNIEGKDRAFLTRLEKIVFKDKKMTDIGKQFLEEAVNRPSIFSTKKTVNVFDLDNLVTKYEGIIQANAADEALLTGVSNVAKYTGDLWDLTTLAGSYTNLFAKGDNVNTLTVKILKERWTAEGNASKYLDLTNTEQISKAKAYAEKVMELNNNAAEWAVETTKIGKARESAKTMFKEGMEKIKSLFSSNKTLSAAQKTGLEEWINKSIQETESITWETVEKAAKNPAGEEAKTVAGAMQGKIGIRARVLKRSPLLIDGIINIFRGVGMMNEADEISEINVERGSVREEKATFTLTLAGVELTVFAVGVALSRNPAWRVILAITVGIEALKYGVNKYYEVVETYYRNFEDFKRMHMAHIKQEIISKEARGDGIDISLQENFQEAVWAVFGSACHGEGKKILSLKTREDALRALIRMEECENYPYATLNLDSFKGTEYTELQTEVNKQSDAMKADSVTRFNYIKEKYGDKFIAAEKIESAGGKEELDRVLLESREYLAMTKDTTTTATDIDTYQAERLAKLKENTWFEKLEAIYASNPLQFHKIMKSFPYYSFLFQQFDKDTYADYDKIKTNMDYVVQYYSYKTFWLLPSNIPDITVDADKVDYSMMEIFFKEFTVKPTGLTKEDLGEAFSNNQLDIMTPDMVESQESVSASLWQNVLYRIAKEVLGGYRGKNDLDDLKQFYLPSEKERNGIYYEDGEWMLNQTSSRYSVNRWAPTATPIYNAMGIGTSDKDKTFATDDTLDDVEKITALSEVVSRFTTESIFHGKMIHTDTGTGDELINAEYGSMINDIIKEELAYRKPEYVTKIKDEALEYIKDNSDGKYIPLSSDLINKLTKAGVENIWYYYYIRDGTKVSALEAIKGAIPTFLASKKCWLTENVETYNVKKIEYSDEIKQEIAVIDTSIAKLSATILLDDEDLDVQDDIKKMIAKKALKRTELKTELNYMDQGKAKILLDKKYEEFKTFFENTYLMILHCASAGSSNDVDTYDDYLSISTYSSASLVDFKTDSGTMQASVAIPDFKYTDEFNATILTYEIPGTKKKIPDLLNSNNADDITLWKKYAEAVLKSVLESAMLDFDANGAANAVYNAGNRDVDNEMLQKRLVYNIAAVDSEVSASKSKDDNTSTDE